MPCGGKGAFCADQHHTPAQLRTASPKTPKNRTTRSLMKYPGQGPAWAGPAGRRPRDADGGPSPQKRPARRPAPGAALRARPGLRRPRPARPRPTRLREALRRGAGLRGRRRAIGVVMNASNRLSSEIISRAHGCLPGRLAGGALGSLVEFQTPEQVRRAYPAGDLFPQDRPRCHESLWQAATLPLQATRWSRPGIADGLIVRRKPQHGVASPGPDQ